MKAVVFALLLAAQAIQFQVTDARGKQTSAFVIETGAGDADGWYALSVQTKGKAKGGEPVLVWPFDALAKAPDGPEPIPAIVIQQGDQKALASKQVMAALATPVLLGISKVNEIAARAGLNADALSKEFSTLDSSSDAFEKGIGLLYEGKTEEAAAQLKVALRERQRQLTRVPSEIFPAALLYGKALYGANKFDDAAVAFLTALKQRPSDQYARRMRSDALAKAGKPEAE